MAVVTTANSPQKSWMTGRMEVSIPVKQSMMAMIQTRERMPEMMCSTKSWWSRAWDNKLTKKFGPDK